MNNKDKIDKETKRRIEITIFGIIGLILLVTGISFAAFSTDLAGTKVQSINTGCLKVDMVDEGSLNIENAMPETDESGLSSDPYVYTITNSCTTAAFYTTTINVMNTSNLDNISKMKVALDGDSYLAPTIEGNLEEIESVDSETTGISKTYKLDEGYLKIGETKTFNLRTWIDYDVTDITGGLENKIIILSEAREGKNIEYKTNTSGYDVLKNNNILTNVKYSNIAPSNSEQTGVVKVEDGNNVKYYFRGNPNNNLTFAGKNFKVLSTNNDGSINIVLDDSAGTSTYSNIKTQLNNWYETNIKSEEEYVKTDQTFCENNGADGEYLAKMRVEGNKPTSTCQGNVLNKVGLLTADDLMFAGAVTGKTNTDFYLKSSSNYYTSSYESANSVYGYTPTNSIKGLSVTTSAEVKPVITLKSNVKISGNGTETNPFYVNGLYDNTNEEHKDSKAPTIDYARIDEKWSNQNKHIEVSANDNPSGSGIAGYLISTTSDKPSLTSPDWEASSKTKYTSVNTYDNGTYYVFVKDNNNNISESKEVIVNKVDKEAPTCSIRINPNETNASYKTLSITSNDKNIDLKGYSWDHTTSIEDVVKVTENGIYTAHITDLAGNKGSCSGVVTNVGTSEIPVSKTKAIVIGDINGISSEKLEKCVESTGYDIVLSYSGDSSYAMDSEIQKKIVELANEYGPENLVVILGTPDTSGSETFAETVTTGDPTFAGPLTEVELGLTVYHVFEDDIKAKFNMDIYSQYIEEYESVFDYDEIILSMEAIRENCLYLPLPNA